MATFYFNGAVDGEWTELGNWWMDDNFTTQATSLPTNSDDVIATGSFFVVNSGSEPTVANFTAFGSLDFDMSITVTGMVTLNDAARILGTITGNATFNGSVENIANVIGNATFNDSSSNVATVTGDATFNDYSQNYSAVNGNATFNDSSVYVSYSTVLGTVTLSAEAAALSLVSWISQVDSGAYIPASVVVDNVNVVELRGVNGSSILGVV